MNIDFEADEDNNTILPTEADNEHEISKIKEICALERDKGKEIVVVQGLGFVGSVVSAVIADSEVNGKIPYFVIGVDLSTSESIRKIIKINNGESPCKAADPEIKNIFNRAVKEKSNLIATWIKEAYSEADIIMVDINLDVVKNGYGNAENSDVNIESFKLAIRDIGTRMKPDSLILIETTVPPGTIEKIVKPIIEQCFLERLIDISINEPQIAHSYERVMPGKEYVNSIKKINRTFSGINKESSIRAKNFLSNFSDVENFPLRQLDRPVASELAKTLENAYRAMNIAFIHEWALYAEEVGVNLFEVVDSIRVRKGTHDNMRYPGFGVGGYCLTKDPILADWAYKNLFGKEKILNLSLEAINVNDLMPLHTFDLLLKGLNNKIKGRKISILGATYREDIDDTRESPSIILYDKIKEYGGLPVVHDPYAEKFEQRKDINIEPKLNLALTDTDAAVITVKHEEYLDMPMENFTTFFKRNRCVIDAFDVLTDSKISYLKEKGFTVYGVGKGHIKFL